MKKNVMMRLACFLLVAVLISTSAISGTYAKYVTQGSASDTARVAKFGVKVTGTSEIFSDSYKDEATDYTVNEKTAEITVQADTEGTNVVAPGTQGDLVEFALEGTPEEMLRLPTRQLWIWLAGTSTAQSITALWLLLLKELTSMAWIMPTKLLSRLLLRMQSTITPRPTTPIPIWQPLKPPMV